MLLIKVHQQLDIRAAPFVNILVGVTDDHQVAMLARRINGKYLAPGCGHLEDRVKEIKNGEFNELIEALMQKPIEEMKELYNSREIEK